MKQNRSSTKTCPKCSGSDYHGHMKICPDYIPEPEPVIEKIVYEFDANESDGIENYSWDIHARYVVIENAEANSGLYVRAWTKKGEEVSPWSDRPVIRRLLADLESEHKQKAELLAELHQARLNISNLKARLSGK